VRPQTDVDVKVSYMYIFVQNKESVLYIREHVFISTHAKKKIIYIKCIKLRLNELRVYQATTL
jgi:hypothetical protein